MKIIYMGTPDFAVPALKKLHETGQEVLLAVSQPDKAKDRGKKIQYPPVKTAALELRIPVSQPEKIRGNQTFYEELRALEPDLIVVAAYGRILPKEILELPPLGCINIHASLLPRYRGAAPIHRAVMNGERETGVTLMYMEEGLDTGDMIVSKKTAVEKKSTADLHDELATMGAELLAETLPLLERGAVPREKQNHESATYAPMVFKEEGRLDYQRPAAELECLIRGFNSWPGAHTSYQGTQVKVWESNVIEEETQEKPGTVLSVSEEGIAVATGEKILLLSRIQFPGKKSMLVKDFIRGNKMETGTVFE